MVASVAAFLESDGFPRTLVAGLEVPTPLYAFGVAVLVRCEKKQELRQLVQLLIQPIPTTAHVQPPMLTSAKVQPPMPTSAKAQPSSMTTSSHLQVLHLHKFSYH